MNRKLSELACVLGVVCANIFVVGCDDSASPSNTNGSTEVVSNPAKPDSVTVAVPTWNKKDYGIPWNDSITYGTVVDSRDRQVYRTVSIGSQTWMAENLNYKTPGADSGDCISNSVDSCAKYGRYYQWSQSVAGTQGTMDGISKIQGICPVGWHVPTANEWEVLVNGVERATGVGIDNGAYLFKARAGWEAPYIDWVLAGVDAYGFRAVSTEGIPSRQERSEWWTATKMAGVEKRVSFTSSSNKLYVGTGDLRQTLRCTKN